MMTQDRAALPAKVVELGGGMTLRIPVAWTYGPADSGGWWCGEMDKSVTVYLYPDIIDPIESDDGRAATPTVHALRETEKIKRFLASTELLGEIAETPIQSGCILQSTARGVEGGRSFRDIRWYIVKGFNDCVGTLCIGLMAREPVADEAALQGLIDHFTAEAHAVNFNLSGGRDGGLNCLQDFAMDGVVTLRVPARWRCRPEDERWYCYNPNGDPGRMWAEYDLFEIRNETGSKPAPYTAEEIAKGMADGWKSNGDILLVKEVSKAPLGAILRVVEDDDPREGEADSDSPPLRRHYWIYVAFGANRGIMAKYCLMIPQSLVDRPGLAELPAIMDCEIRAQRIGEGFRR